MNDLHALESALEAPPVVSKPNGAAASFFAHASRSTLPSRTCPGVTYTIHKISVARRGRLEELIAPERERYFRLLDELRPLPLPLTEEEIAAGKAEDVAITIARSSILSQINIIYDRAIIPANLRVMLHSISGLSINGEPATVDSLIEDGPPALVMEIFRVIDAGTRLKESEAGESESRTTSSGQEAGRDKSSTAPPAAGSDTGASASA